MRTSLIQLKAEFKIIADAHEQVNSFFWGAPDRAVMETTQTYPLMCCYVTAAPVNLARRVTTVSIAVVVVDKVYKDYVSLDDTISDTLQVVRDVQNTLHSPRWLALIRKPTASGSKIFNSEQDEISGWGIQFKIDIKDDGSYCNLPMAGYDFGSQPSPDADCLPGTAINSTATFSLSVPSGGVSQLPDITHTDSDGSPVTLPAQTAFVATSCASSTIIYRPPMPSGQWSIFRTNDEGWNVQNGTHNYVPTQGTYVDLDKSTSAYFTTVTPNNVYGNANRFTNDLGGSVTDGTDGSTANYMIDHYTGLGWGIVVRGPFNWNAVIDDATALTIGVYNDFRNPSQPEGEAISNPQLSAVFNYAPFNITASIRTSTTPAISTGRAYTLASNGDITFPTKTTTSTYIPVRNHFV